MMLVSVGVSTGLVFAGLALLDMCLFGDFGSPAIIGIAVVVVVFAGLLTAVVINTLTTTQRHPAPLLCRDIYRRQAGTSGGQPPLCGLLG